MDLQEMVPDRRTSRGRLAGRLTRAFVLLAGVSLLIVGLILILVSRSAQIEQIALLEQRTAEEAVLATSAYLSQARDILSIHAQTKNLLFLSARSQNKELRDILNRHLDLFETLILIDDRGREQAKVSRFYTFLEPDLGSQAGNLAVQEALKGRTYIDRKVSRSERSGMPVLTIAVPHEYGGIRGVLLGHVRIRGMWDAMAQVEVGRTGYAYIVDRKTGRLIAHSEIAHYQQLLGESLAYIPLVRAWMVGAKEKEAQYQGLIGRPVIGAAAPFPQTDWILVVELPTREALASTRQMMFLLAGLLMAGIAAAVVMGLIVPRRIARPLLMLQEGVREIGRGHLDHTLHLQTQDEIEDLAQAFNQMAANLKVARAESERWSQELESRVETRTRELAEASARMERRTVQLQTSAEVARAIASMRDLDRLLPQVTQMVSERFGWYHVGIFLLDDAGEYAVLRAANSAGGQQMLSHQHRLRAGETGIVGYVAASGRPRIALDVGQDAAYFDNPHLPETRSEMALPLQISDRIIGVLDVQSDEAAAFDEEDVALLSTLADQIALAIENARLFEESRQALREVQLVHRQYLKREWSRVLTRRGQLAYEYRSPGTPPLTDVSLPELDLVLQEGQVIVMPGLETPSGNGDAGHGPQTPCAAIATPIKLREQIIGAVDLQEVDRPRDWTEDEIALVQSVSDQVALALENVRLLEAEQQQRMAAEALRKAAVVLSSTLAFEGLVERILVQVSRVVPSDASNLMLFEGERARVVGSRGYEQFGAAGRLQGLVLPIAEMSTLSEMKETGKPVLIPDTAAHPGWRVREGLEWLRSYLAAPILIRGQTIGVLNLDSSLPGFFTEEHVTMLEAFASQTAIALQNSRLMDETSRRAEQMATLNRIGLALASGLELERVLDTLREQCQQTFAADSFYVALLGQDAQTIDFPLFSSRQGGATLPTRSLTQDYGPTGHVIRTKQPLLLTGSRHGHDGPLPSLAPVPEWDCQSYIGVPMIFRDRVIGVISVQSAEPEAYTTDDVNLMTTIATQASIAIENARAYQRQVETAAQLREIDRLKNQFLANMSHELRTPLNSIIGFSRVMLKGIDGPLTDLQNADLQSIYNSGQHLLHLINDILDMSKIEAGRMDLSFDEFSVTDALQSVLSTGRALIKDRPIELHSDVPDDLPTVWADAQRVRQILINLISNAAKFTERGEIRLRAEAHGEFVTISVADTGIGIDREAQKKLFVPFQQVDASATRRAGGTGLGLAICRSFVEMHGGQIWVESEPDRGSTFSFTLPIYRVICEQAEGETEILADSERRVVLVIDDDMGVISLLKRYLEQEGYQVVGVTQARRAVEVAERLAPRLAAITLDVVMPQMDGWQVLRALKQEPSTRDIPVILCSIVEGLERGLEMGAAAFLSKPVTRDEVLAAVRQVCRSG